MRNFTFTSLPASLHDLLDHRAAAFPDRVYAVMDGAEWTYGEIAGFSRGIAGFLKEAGAAAGERVLVMMPASKLSFGLWFGLSRIGAVETPVNPAYKGALLAQLIQTADPCLCIVHDDCLDEFRRAAEGLVSADKILAPQDVGAAEFDLASAGPAPYDTSCIVFTSGTTGQSKGVMMSQSHQLSFGQSFREIVGLTERDTAYNFLPFFHIAAKFVALGTMLAGGRLVLRNGFSVSNFWSDVRAHDVTVCAAVGGLCHMLNSQPPRPDDDANPLRIIYSVPVPWEFKESFEARFGVQFIEGYGATESNLVAFSRLSDDTPRSSCGRASPYFEIQIQNELGHACAAGEAGEICVRPRMPGTMMSGYFRAPEKTLEVMPNYWFHTGDRGYADEYGYIFFLDRLKDAIRRRGENISSFEVERILNGFPAVAEAAVIPVKSEIGEEEVKAIIVLKSPSAATAEEIFLFAVENMPYFMVPRFIEFVSELPRTPTMKIKKAELRALGNSDATWDCETAGYRIGRSGVRASAKELQ